MAFPTSPSDGATAIVNGILYTYASATNSWTRSPAASSTLSVISDSFTGDGATVSYTLSNTPVSVDVVTCIVDGVPQLRGAFTLSSNILTFTGTPANGALIEIRTMQVAGLGVLTGLVYNTFTGDGSTTIYTLSTQPTNKNYTIVTVNGTIIAKSAYSVSGTTLTFNSAPANSAVIEVTTLGPAVTTATPNTLQNGTSSINVLLNDGITFSTAGTSNVMVVSNTGTTVTGNLSVSNNFTLGSWSNSSRPSGVNGMMGYNTTTNNIDAYINGVWTTLTHS
jgi:hypothetical protein